MESLDAKVELIKNKSVNRIRAMPIKKEDSRNL